MKYKIIMILLVLFVFSMISGACATDKTSDDMNDFSHYTTASKIAYAETIDGQNVKIFRICL